MAKDRFDTPKTPVALDVTDLSNFEYDMSRCIKCKGCYWVEHTYMPGVRFCTRCPSNVWNDFDSYGAFGKMRIGTALLEGKLQWTPKLLEIIYADPLCGACDVGCKRNLDLEIGLTLEALRVKAVKDGAGPMPAHKKIAAEHRERAQPVRRAPREQEEMDHERHQGRRQRRTPSISSDAPRPTGTLRSPRSTAKILNGSGTPFMLMPDEWCCGNTRLLRRHDRRGARRSRSAISTMVKATGAKRVVTLLRRGLQDVEGRLSEDAQHRHEGPGLRGHPPDRVRGRGLKDRQAEADEAAWKSGSPITTRAA